MKLDDFQRTLLQEASKTRGKGGYASRSAKRHLDRALALKDQMPEVSVFLAITAEEEAATALFSALKKRKYQGAAKLKDKDHRFKAGVYPFIKLLGPTIGAIKHNVPLELYFEAKPKKPTDGILKVRMPLAFLGYGDLSLMPDPPLNLHSVGPDGVPTDYSKAVKEVATEEGIESIYKYIEGLSNIRNQMLYASDSGIPRIDSVEESLEPHLKGVFANLSAYLLVEPHPKQNLVQEALTAFLNIQRRLEARET